MSQENMEVVRYPLSVRATSRRSLEERLALRFPGVAALGSRALLRRLPPRSRLRQKMVRRAARLFLEAYNRKDFEAAYSLYHPESETTVPHQLVGMGFEPVITGGPEAIIDLQRRWHADWGEFRFEPEEVIDLDGRWLVLGQIRSRGLSSGAGIDTDWALIVTVVDGRIIRDQFYFDHREVFEAVGLSE